MGDTKDVYVMANATNQTITNHTPRQQRKHQYHNTLAVPKWTNNDDLESADEYDSEAHTQNDEDVIIKRVLAKFNQQNKEIIRKKLSFSDSLQFFQNNIDKEKHERSISS